MEDKNKKNQSENKDKGMWVPQFNKYMNDLTDEEWLEMTNSSCGDVDLKNCESDTNNPNSK